MNHWPGKKEPQTNPLDPMGSSDRIQPQGDLAPSPCPRCQQPMELAKADDHFILMCQSCQGLLVQSEILGMLIQARRKRYTGPEDAPEPMNTRELETRIKCPGCGKFMDVHPYHGPGNAVIDSCSRCKFAFLDQGELAKIERAPGLR